MSEVHSEADISRIADPAALVSTRPSLAPSQWHRMAMRAAPQSGRRGIYAAFMKTSFRAHVGGARNHPIITGICRTNEIGGHHGS